MTLYYAISLFITLAAVAVHFVWLSYIMKRAEKLHSMQVLATSHIIAAALIFTILPPQSALLFSNSNILYAVGAVGVLMWLARMMYYYAYSHCEVGEVAIFSSLTPIYGLIFSLFVGYQTDIGMVLGISLICASVYCYFYQKHQAHLKPALLQPLKKIFYTPPLRIAFFSTLPPALAIVFHKEAVDAASPLLISFWICAIIGMLTVVSGSISMGKKMFRTSKVIILHLTIAGILQAAMTISLSYFLQLEHPAATQALLRLAIIMQIILAYWLLKERMHFKQHVLSGILALIGTYLIIKP